MKQTWDPEVYGREGAFVHELAGGVVDWLAPQAGERILDLGCGDGKLTLRLADCGAEVNGVDASASMVDAARSRGVHADQASAELLPYGDRTYDAVFSNAALHWVRDQDAMLSEVHRVLKPGGRFVTEMGGFGNIAAISVALSAVLSRYGHADKENQMNYFPSPSAYARRLERHGFEVRRMELIPRPTPLGDGGMAAWLGTFRRGMLDDLPPEVRLNVIAETCGLLEPSLRDEDGRWVADYVRLRFVAAVSG